MYFYAFKIGLIYYIQLNVSMFLLILIKYQIILYL